MNRYRSAAIFGLLWLVMATAQALTIDYATVFTTKKKKPYVLSVKV